MSPYRLITAVVLAALAGSATGCTAIALSSTQGDPNPYSGNDAGVGTDGGNYLVDAMTPGDAVTTSPLSPLCTSPSAKCRPDDSKLSSLVSSCGLAPYVDAGTDADASAAPAAKLACRVVYDEQNNKSAPQCVTAGDANDGDPCTQGSDCKVGFECVGTPGRCRHYCCAPDECTTLTQNSNGKTYFCDVQPQAASPAVKVPVCLVAQPCELLKDKCGTGMTCALVDSNLGTTSCVATGPAQQGQDCEKTHCGANLTCLGALGSRVCERLCDAMHSCGSTQTCTYKFPALKQQGVGICQ